MRSMLNIVGSACVLAACMASSVATAQSAVPVEDVGERRQESMITVTGTARVERAPDYVDVWIGVVAEDPTAAGAQSKASKVSAAAVAAVQALKLPGTEVQTGSVELTPRYHDPHGEDHVAQIVGYSASMTFRVRTTDVQGVAKVIDAGIGAGCNRVESVTFGIKEALSAREEATRLALKAARRKAGVMAEALEVKVGRLVSASTMPRQVSPWGGRWSANNISQVAFSQGGGGGGEGDEQAVVPGKVEIWVDATVTYAVGEAK